MRSNKPAYPPPAARAQTGRGGAGRSRGYTLIELMIVVTVLGILTALAVPSYLNYVTESARSDAMISLTTMAARQELYFSNNGRYATDEIELGYCSAPPCDFKSEEGQYKLSIEDCAPASADCTRLTADADDGVALKDTDCVRFELDSFGRRVAEDDSGNANNDCWN